jgi:hypothetical protein
VDDTIDYPDYGAATDPQYDGHDHEWPPELDADAQCDICLLAYGDWSEVP